MPGRRPPCPGVGTAIGRRNRETPCGMWTPSLRPLVLPQTRLCSPGFESRGSPRSLHVQVHSGALPGFPATRIPGGPGLPSERVYSGACRGWQRRLSGQAARVQSQLHRLAAVWPWANYFTSLCLHFLTEWCANYAWHALNITHVLAVTITLSVLSSGRKIASASDLHTVKRNGNNEITTATISR